MKMPVQHLSDDFLKAYPLRDAAAAGWYFKIQEVSYGVYEMQGVDGWGRKVSRKGTDPDELRKLGTQDAPDLISNVNAGDSPTSHERTTGAT